MLEALALVAALTGEPLPLLRAVVERESGGREGAVRYCTEWHIRPDGRARCKREASCYHDCTRPRIWKHRMDCGIFQLRCVPRHVSVNGERVRTRHTNWPRRLGVAQDCPMDADCAARMLAQIINQYKALPPKKCGSRGIPDERHSWLAYFSGGTGNNRRGCGARAKRIRMMEEGE